MKSSTNIDSSLNFLELIRRILKKTPKIAKWQLEFILHGYELQCQLRGIRILLDMAAKMKALINQNC